MFKTGYLEHTGLSEMVEGIVRETDEDEILNDAFRESSSMFINENNEFTLSESTNNAYLTKIAKEVVTEIKRGQASGKIDHRKCKKIVDDGLKVYMKEVFQGKKLAKAYLLTLLVSSLNTIALLVCVGILGEKKGVLVGAGICGPIIEEVSKFISVSKGFDKQNSLVFNATEYTLYVQASIARQGKFNAKFAGKRAGIQMLHVIFMAIQKHYYDKAKELEKESGGKTTKSQIIKFSGLIIAIVAHSLWNSAHAIIAYADPKD